MRANRHLRALLAGALAVLAVTVSVSAASAWGAGGRDPAPWRPATEGRQERVFSFVEITAGRLLVAVRRPARLTVFVNGQRLHRRRLERNRVYEIPIHRRGRIRVVAVAGHGRDTVIFHVSFSQRSIRGAAEWSNGRLTPPRTV